MSNVDRLLAERKLLRFSASVESIKKEVEAATEDLRDAEESHRSGRDKWATIQAYYSMFHSARALLFRRGLREKSHRALLTALGELYQDELPPMLLERFDAAMNLREEADYSLRFSGRGAGVVISAARDFLKIVSESKIE